MTLELVHLCDARYSLREPVAIPDTPMGTRMVFEIETGELEGDRLRAVVRPGAASGDWVTLDARGIATLDVRLVVETHDGADVFVSYRGRSDAATGGPVFAAPIFDTGDERYAWLNVVQAVAKGTLTGSELRYEIYEVR